MVNLQLITDVPSSSSSTDCSEKYDVFLSFRGEDTRNNFTSLVYDALVQKKVKTFIDYELERGDEISPTLMKAIEESHASIIIFSKNYASSKWCLEELTKIMECKKEEGHVVIPVFYEVDPAHVRKQVGSYKQAFKKHEQDMRHNMKKVQEWRLALTQAANLAGWTWDSQSDRTECEFIKDIVGDVMKKLNIRYPIKLKGVVGIEEKCAKIESLLKLESSEVRIVGIWGMGGVGKTTLASALYAKLSSSFEGECFLENVREESEKNGLNSLNNKLLSKLLKEENFSLNAPRVVPQFVKIRLRRTKVFIVLDDVATSEQLESLIIVCDWLGSGSRVIVTTRNAQVLMHVHEIYKVQELNHDDSLELFCAKAFSEKHPKNGYEELLEAVLDYCKGLPLALNVLGALLHERSKEVWEDELGKLKTTPNVKIHHVLKLSYDNLDHTQKNIFLDIACFLKGKSKDHIKRFFEACDFFPNSGIQVLLDLALITISSSNTIEMHDLIQEMGQKIVRQSNEDPRRRSRFWNPKDVCDIFNSNKGYEVVEGIMLDMSQIQNDIILSSDSFANMSKLRYLEFRDSYESNYYYIRLPNGLGSLPYELRYLCWPTYCLKFLPSTFRAEMLVELRMPNSNLEKLWDGVQNLGNLKIIDLDGSRQLVEVPDLCMAQNLEEVSLSKCESLREVHPSIFSLPKLRILDLRWCAQIESLNSDIHMKSLQLLYLFNCSSLKEFSVTSEEMAELHLDCTAIHDIPSSFLRNRKLRNLYLEHCVNLKMDWNKLFDDRVLRYLKHLSLIECKQVDASDVGHILDGVPSLDVLILTGSNIESLPANVKNLSMLRYLYLEDCMKLVTVPELPPSLRILSAINCTSLELDTNFIQRLLLQQHSDDGYVILPGGHVPELFRSTTETTSITIPYLPFSNLSGLLLCIILSNPYSYILVASCDIYEHDEVTFTSERSLFTKAFNSDHAMFWFVDIKDLQQIQKGGANDHFNNISFQFDMKLGSTKEGIKGSGVLPVYAKDLELKLGGVITKDIVDLESNAQSSNNQEPLPLTDTQMQDEEKELIENVSSDCFVGNDIKPVFELVNPQYINEPPVLPNQQPKKRRRKGIPKIPGKKNDDQGSNKHVKVNRTASGKTASLKGNNTSNSFQNLVAPGEHYKDLKVQNKSDVPGISSQKKTADTKSTLDPSVSLKASKDDVRVPTSVTEGKDADKQKTGVIQSKKISDKYKDASALLGASHQKYHEKGAHAHSKSQPGRSSSNIDDSKKRKKVMRELPDLNLSEGKSTMQVTRNLKEMISTGLSAKQEKDVRFQQIKKEVVDMIRIQAPTLESKQQQKAEASGDFQEFGPDGKAITKNKFSMDTALEDKISDLYDLFVDGLDESAVPQIRKLYAELAELWPNGCMDKHGIRRGICRAKDRRRALHSKHKEKLKRKKLSVPKPEENVLPDTGSIAAQQNLREKVAPQSSSHAFTSVNKPVSDMSTTAQVPSPSMNGLKQEKARKSSSSSLDNVKVENGGLTKKKVKRKPEHDLEGAHFGPDKKKQVSLMGEARPKSLEQSAGLHTKSKLQPTAIPGLEQSS